MYRFSSGRRKERGRTYLQQEVCVFLRETNTSTIFTSTCFFQSIHVSVMSVRKQKCVCVCVGGGLNLLWKTCTSEKKRKTSFCCLIGNKIESFSELFGRPVDTTLEVDDLWLIKNIEHLEWRPEVTPTGWTQRVLDWAPMTGRAEESSSRKKKKNQTLKWGGREEQETSRDSLRTKSNTQLLSTTQGTISSKQVRGRRVKLTVLRDHIVHMEEGLEGGGLRAFNQNQRRSNAQRCKNQKKLKQTNKKSS